MTVNTIYRVSVAVNEAVFREFGDTSEYDQKVAIAISGSISAGQNSYSDVEEWAEFHTLSDARVCDKRFMDIGYYFAAKLPPTTLEKP